MSLTPSTVHRRHLITTNCTTRFAVDPGVAHVASYAVTPPQGDAWRQRFVERGFASAAEARANALAMAIRAIDAALAQMSEVPADFVLAGPIVARWEASEDALRCDHLHRVDEARRRREDADRRLGALDLDPAVKCVMVVDDHRGVAEALAEILTEHCCTQVTVEIGVDGAQAIDIALARRPAVALIDIAMPVMDGLDAAREIRATMGHSAPLMVAMTGNTAWLAERDAMQVFDHVLPKPVNIDRLTRIVAQA